ncbi:MAG: hypothetical protein HZA31_11325 [Opitutae bacterium]|nr:hypothetical protein [Opitutae bacterium]
MSCYCTYFDRHYLAPGLALLESVWRCEPTAEWWLLCLDDDVAETAARLADPRLHLLTLAEIEAADPELAAAKANRSLVEYYFTLTPCLPRHVLARNPGLERLTYLDADMLLFRPLAPILAQDGASVVITAHRFPEECAGLVVCGKYNVGLLSFRNDAAARTCLDWWRERCVEWCYDRHEAGRYADQKYLDTWPERFPGVVVLPHVGVNCAPWNWRSADWRVANGEARAGETPLVLFHFARFRRWAGPLWDSGQVDFGVMPRPLRRAIYGAYVAALRAAENRLRKLGVPPAGASPRLRPARYTPGHWAWMLWFGGLWCEWGWWALGGGPWGARSGAVLERRRARKARTT